jgi:hypothetical protein
MDPTKPILGNKIMLIQIFTATTTEPDPIIITIITITTKIKEVKKELQEEDSQTFPILS